MNMGNLSFPKIYKEKLITPNVKCEMAYWLYINSLGKHIAQFQYFVYAKVLKCNFMMLNMYNTNTILNLNSGHVHVQL